MVGIPFPRYTMVGMYVPVCAQRWVCTSLYVHSGGYMPVNAVPRWVYARQCCTTVGMYLPVCPWWVCTSLYAHGGYSSPAVGPKVGTPLPLLVLRWVIPLSGMPPMVVIPSQACLPWWLFLFYAPSGEVLVLFYAPFGEVLVPFLLVYDRFRPVLT